MTSDIGKLVRVPLREVWKHEAHDISQWLMDNIGVLNEALDLRLVNVDREQPSGSFSKLQLRSARTGLSSRAIH